MRAYARAVVSFFATRGPTPSLPMDAFGPIGGVQLTRYQWLQSTAILSPYQ